MGRRSDSPDNREKRSERSEEMENGRSVRAAPSRKKSKKPVEGRAKEYQLTIKKDRGKLRRRKKWLGEGQKKHAG